MVSNEVITEIKQAKKKANIKSSIVKIIKILFCTIFYMRIIHNNIVRTSVCVYVCVYVDTCRKSVWCNQKYKLYAAVIFICIIQKSFLKALL